jgi:hypothetical protein
MDSRQATRCADGLIGKFKTPSLYNVAVTGPYMHDGSIPKLSDAIAHEIYYSAPERGAGLDFEDRRALEAFLRELTDERFAHLLERSESCAHSTLLHGPHSFGRCKGLGTLDVHGHRPTAVRVTTTVLPAIEGLPASVQVML